MEGANINDVVTQWGYPSEQKEFEGRKLYVWNYSKSAFIPQSSTTIGSFHGNTYYGETSTYGGYAIQGSCIRILEFDSNGYVTRWEWQGNNCPFAEWMEYSNWRNK